MNTDLYVNTGITYWPDVYKFYPWLSDRLGPAAGPDKLWNFGEILNHNNGAIEYCVLFANAEDMTAFKLKFQL